MIKDFSLRGQDDRTEEETFFFFFELSSLVTDQFTLYLVLVFLQEKLNKKRNEITIWREARSQKWGLHRQTRFQILIFWIALCPRTTKSSEGAAESLRSLLSLLEKIWRAIPRSTGPAADERLQPALINHPLILPCPRKQLFMPIGLPLSGSLCRKPSHLSRSSPCLFAPLLPSP